jgi:cyclopropane fatty-acyl-phospholipid synthase-like methyltransferase
MGQITSGFRAVLSSPIVYDSLQKLMGADQVRRQLVDEFIRPYKGCRILDLGCGTAEILQYLPNDIEYWGYDISPEYINAAKNRYGNRGYFHCGLLNEKNLVDLPKFNKVLALGVLHHLEDDESRGFFALANSLLNSGGSIITIDPCLADGQNPIARYLINKDRGQNVRESDAYKLLASNIFTKVKGSLRHRNWIPYTHWIMECTK